MLRSLIALIITAFAATLGKAEPRSSVPIRIGETLILRFVGNRVEVLDRRGAGELSPFEFFALRQSQGIYVPPNTEKVPALPVIGDAPAPIVIIPNQVRITFREVQGAKLLDTHAFLTIENGYAQSFRFKAAMHAGAKFAPTDVCEVFAGVPGFEHWPYHIEWIELSDLRLDEAIGPQPRCE
jgi:hypothetical protein